MRKLPPPLRAALVVAVLALGAFAAYRLLVSPERERADAISRQIDDVRGQIEEAQGGSSAPGAPSVRIADLFRLSRAMPDRPDIPNVLLQLSQIANETGITFQSITPHDPEPLSGYERIPIDLVFQGHFYDLSDFLYRLRSLVGVHDGRLNADGRLFAVQSVMFEEGDLKFPQVRAKLTVDAYQFDDTTAAPATSSPSSSPPSSLAAPAAPATPTPAESASAAPPTDGGAQPVPAAPAGASGAGA
jgi:Tfp pilus assembly protein PilO